MITIVVAEDQLLIQKDICRKIEKTGKNVRIVGTAINGKEAYEKIWELRPDLLITDIRMPCQDGMTLLRRIKEEGLSLHTIILSGYRDFTYAREALPLGVNDYLTKPVSIEDLRLALDSVEKKVMARQEKVIVTTLNELMLSKSPSSPDYISCFPYEYYYLMALNLDSFSTFSLRDSLPYEEELRALLHGTTFHKYLREGERHYVLDGSNCNELFILFGLHSLAEDTLTLLAEELIHKIEFITQSATICISNRLTDVSAIGIYRQLLQTQLRNQLIYARSSIIHSRNFLSAQSVHACLLDSCRIEQFKFCIHSQNLDEFFRKLKEFLCLCEKEKVTQRALESDLIKILELCLSSVEHIKINNLKLETEEYISNSRTYSELYDSLLFLFQELYQKSILNSRSPSDPETLVKDIQQYIQDNFRREINIHDIASHFSITPAYLSRLFKKFSDTRPIEYLMHCRINLACRYFQESTLSVREVSELCGYANQHYFSKAFKHITSYSPSEYKSKHQTQ